MILLIIAIILIVCVFWSLAAAGKIIDPMLKARKDRPPCPYCRSPEHGRSYHVPG